jgi:hypothetical protein
MLRALVLGKTHYFMGILPGIEAFSAAALVLALIFRPQGIPGERR